MSVNKRTGWWNHQPTAIFEHQAPWKAILKFMWPTILNTVISSIYSFFISLVAIKWAAGNLDSGLSIQINRAALLTGFSFSMSIFLILEAFVYLFAIGLSTHLTIAIGKKDKTAVNGLLGNNLILAIGVSIVVMIAVYFLLPTWLNFQANLKGDQQSTAQVLAIAKQQGQLFAIFLTFGFPLMMFSTVIAHSFLAEGRYIISKVIAFVPLLITMALMPIFFIVCHMDLLGAGIAIVVSWAVQALLCILFLITSNSFINIKACLNWRLKWSNINKVLFLGVGPILLSIFGSIQVTLMNHALAIGPTKMIDSKLVPYWLLIYSAGSAISLLLIHLSLALTQAVRPFIGYYYQSFQANWPKIKTYLKWAFIYNVGLILIAYVVLVAGLLPVLLTYVYHLPAAIRPLAYKANSIFLITTVLYAIGIIPLALFQGRNQYLKTIIAYTARDGIAFLPWFFIIQAIVNQTNVWLLYFVLFIICSATTIMINWGLFGWYYHQSHLSNKPNKVKIKSNLAK